MFRWFAPLLLLAGKPEVLIRLAVGILAGAVLFFGVWLISNIAITVDTLKNPYIAAAYGAVLFLFFVVVGMVAWLRLRRLSAPAKLVARQAEPELPLAEEVVSKRAQELSNKWEAQGRRAARLPDRRIGAVPAARPAGEPPRAVQPACATLTVTGPSYAGKTALIGALVGLSRGQPFEASDTVRLIDAGPIDGDEQHVSELIADAAQTDGVLFVVDQDLRAPEVAAIKGLLGNGKPLYVVLNKADQFNASDRDAILVSIRAKMPARVAAADVAAVAGAPSPVEREIEDARGAIRVELRRPSSDITALTNLLNRVVRPAPGRALRFEVG